MANPQKVSFAKLRVGVMALVAMFIVAVLIFLLTGRKNLFQRTFDLKTYMDDSAGMTEGTTVRLNGILVGNVDKLRLSGLKDPRRVVEIVMTIQYDFMKEIPKDSMAGIAASNLLGDKFINISKGSSPQHVQPGDEIASVPNQDIPELMAQSASLLAQFQDLLGRVNSILNDVEAGKGNIGKMLKDEELYTRLNAAIADAQQLLSAVRTGKGTISHLLNDDELYQDVRASIGKL